MVHADVVKLVYTTVLEAVGATRESSSLSVGTYMNTLEARRMAAQLSTDLPTLDLHGLYPAEALDSLELFLYNAYQSGTSAVHVVCGIGSGQLASQVVECLRNHPLVDEVFQEAGKCIVLFGR